MIKEVISRNGHFIFPIGEREIIRKNRKYPLPFLTSPIPIPPGIINFAKSDRWKKVCSECLKCHGFIPRLMMNSSRIVNMLFIVAKRSSVSGDAERAIKPRHSHTWTGVDPSSHFHFYFDIYIYIEKGKKYDTIVSSTEILTLRRITLCSISKLILRSFFSFFFITFIHFSFDEFDELLHTNRTNYLIEKKKRKKGERTRIEMHLRPGWNNAGKNFFSIE